jgi:hypothetical protein
MNVTLRKAHALSKALLEQAKRLPLKRTVTISIYDEEAPEDRVDEAAEALVANLGTAARWSPPPTPFGRRSASPTSQAGIDDLLSEKARLDAEEKLLAQVIDANGSDYEFNSATDPAFVINKLEAIVARNKTGAAYGSATEELTVKVASSEIVAPLADDLAVLRRRKTEIGDELLSKNSGVMVALDASVVELLGAAKLI